MSFTPRQQIRRARSLRRVDTPAEARLWSNLRGRRLQNFKFVRQVPIGPYIVDFLCREMRLIVEVDGATHSEDREIAYDRRREAYLKAEGYRIVRVQNEGVYKHINDVLIRPSGTFSHLRWEKGKTGEVCGSGKRNG